jgi:hypothetical protein
LPFTIDNSHSRSRSSRDYLSFAMAHQPFG